MAFVAMAVGWTLAPERDGAATIEASAIDPDLLRTSPGTSATPGRTASPSPNSSPGSSLSPSPSPVPAAAPPATAPTTNAPPPQVPAAAPAQPGPQGGGGGRVPGGQSGVYASSMAQVQAWESFRGSPVDVVQTFAARGNWSTIKSPWMSAPEKLANFPGTWVISQPFYPTGQGDLRSCASGAYNSHWREFGQWMVSKGRPASIVRLAWEFNGNWFPWSVNGNTTDWVGCFRQVVSAIRSTNPQARIDWTMNAHSGNPWAVYPGNEYVDIVGIDTYDMWPASTTEAIFDEQCNRPAGLCSVIRFAREHGKQFSVPEWGLVGKSDTEAGRAGQAGGDNPVYIRKMYETLQANADVLAYEAYFGDSLPGNVHSSLINPTEHPNGAATYASLW